MSKLHFTTKHANEATVKRNWYVVDGTNQTVGRMCSRIAAVLRGKNKASYTPHVDTGDYVIVTNCEKIVFTGNKLEQKLYDHFTGYPGGLKEEVASNLLKRRPEVIIERAVKNSYHVYEVIPEGEYFYGSCWDEIFCDAAKVIKYIGNARGIYKGKSSG